MRYFLQPHDVSVRVTAQEAHGLHGCLADDTVERFESFPRIFTAQCQGYSTPAGARCSSSSRRSSSRRHACQEALRVIGNVRINQDIVMISLHQADRGEISPPTRDGVAQYPCEGATRSTQDETPQGQRHYRYEWIEEVEHADEPPEHKP